jgi:hypothetical protein
MAETLWKDYENKKENFSNESGSDDEAMTIDSMNTSRKDKKMEDIQNKDSVKEVKSTENEIIKDNSDIFLTEKDIKNNSTTDRVEGNVKKRSGGKRFGFILIFFIAFGASLYGAFMAGRVTTEKETIVVREEVPVVTDSVVNTGEKLIEPTDVGQVKTQEEEAVEADLSKTNILVLNGGFTAGAAGDAEKLITENEKKVENIEAENAVGNYDSGVFVYYEDKFEKEAEKISEILKEAYESVLMSKIAELSEDEKKDDIVVIIGK